MCYGIYEASFWAFFVSSTHFTSGRSNVSLNQPQVSAIMTDFITRKYSMATKSIWNELNQSFALAVV